jgi:osmotically-inducible protein OsmY
MIRLIVVAPAVLGLIAVSYTPAAAQTQAEGDAQAVVDALRANPYVAPYEIRVTPGEKGSIVLSGKVGTKQVHDVVIRTVINLGLVPHDDLVIDTAEAHRAALNQSYYGPQAGLYASAGTAPYFAYPPPLFGRLDDPFWGLVPPILSFPPGYTRPAPRVMAVPARAAALPDGQDDDSIKGNVKLVIDAAGQVFLSGEVATEKDRRDIEREVQEAVGGAPIASDLQVAERAAPPPPPEPMIGPPDEAPEKTPKSEPAGRATPRDADPLTDRVVKALARRPAVKESPITARTNDDVVTLSGKVPSAYEAMLAYRTVEQVPGVHGVIDQLEFPMPDENHPNPLKGKADPDDLEPYLTYQVRRHVGDLAHIDRVRVHGDVVEVHGSLRSDDDKERIAATLRSIPLLRDFRIEPNFHVD